MMQTQNNLRIGDWRIVTCSDWINSINVATGGIWIGPKRRDIQSSSIQLLNSMVYRILTSI